MPFNRPTTQREYDPALVTRFFRSQWSRNGELEAEEYYRPSSVIAAWAAARPFPNLVPFVFGPHAIYNLPSGPTQPSQLLQQLTVPPNFPAADFRIYQSDRYAPPGGFEEPGPAGGSGSGTCCPRTFSPEEQASIFAAGIKKILPELATSIGVQSARANAQQVHSRPASIDPPVRAYDFVACSPTPRTVSDSAFADLTSFTVPVGWCAVAKSIGFEAESAGALSDIRFRVLVGDIPVPNLDSVSCGGFGSLQNPTPITVKAIEQQRIRVQAIALTPGVSHFVKAAIRGWTFQPSLMANLDSINGWRGQ
jgi:hypothetical protein